MENINYLTEKKLSNKKIVKQKERKETKKTKKETKKSKDKKKLRTLWVRRKKN